jgi:hypothetical protein
MSIFKNLRIDLKNITSFTSWAHSLSIFGIIYICKGLKEPWRGGLERPPMKNSRP